MTQRPPRVLEDDIKRILDTAATRAETDRRAADIAETVTKIIQGFNAIGRENEDVTPRYVGKFVATMYICEAAGLNGASKAVAYAVAEQYARDTSRIPGWNRRHISDMERALCGVLGVKPR